MRTTTKMRTVRTRRRPRQPRLPRHGGLAIALPRQYATTLPPSLLLPHTPRPPANPIPPRRRAAGSSPALCDMTTSSVSCSVSSLTSWASAHLLIRINQVLRAAADIPADISEQPLTSPLTSPITSHQDSKRPSHAGDRRRSQQTIPLDRLPPDNHRRASQLTTLHWPVDVAAITSSSGSGPQSESCAEARQQCSWVWAGEWTQWPTPPLDVQTRLFEPPGMVASSAMTPAFLSKLSHQVPRRFSPA